MFMCIRVYKLSVFAFESMLIPGQLHGQVPIGLFGQILEVVY